jgi:hypothetical protein
VLRFVKSLSTKRSSVPPPSDEEANVGGPATHDDRIGIRESPAIDIDRKITFGQTAERSPNAAQKLIVRRARTDRFTNCKRDELANAQRRRERKGSRAVYGHGVEIERYPHANHRSHFLLLRGAACRWG